MVQPGLKWGEAPRKLDVDGEWISDMPTPVKDTYEQMVGTSFYVLYHNTESLGIPDLTDGQVAAAGIDPDRTISGT